MARLKDLDWNLNNGQPNPDGGRSYNTDTIQAALLMDIRDELKRLNKLLHCENFQTMPKVLRRIDKRLMKKIPPR